MKAIRSLLLASVLSTVSGCGGPLGFRDIPSPLDEEAPVDTEEPAVSDAVSADASAPSEDVVLAEDVSQPAEDADPAFDVAAEAAVSADVQADTMFVNPDAAPVDVREDAPLATRDAGTDGRAATQDARPDVVGGCRSTADCNDGLADTIDGCELVSGICRHERCDDGNPCTANVATSTGCMFPVLPDFTSCRPGPIMFVCIGGVCPPCGGENEVCCEWPGSSTVCQGARRCRTIPGGLRRCITCGRVGERCCTSSDGIMWASQRCDVGLTCSTSTGVSGFCR